MYGAPNLSKLVRRLTRLANDMYRLPRKRRPRPGISEEPVGPRLVRGRGLARRRTLSRLGAALVYLVLAAGLTVVVFKYFVAPIVAP
ncbi:MAG: hypothetical protein ACYTDU_06560 [Planctomycetota bacterium]|jgi:hypothetical protein